MTNSVAALLLWSSITLLCCARPVQVAKQVIPGVLTEDAVKVARRVATAEGYRMVVAEDDPSKLSSNWLEQGHRERRVIINMGEAKGETQGVRITLRVFLRRRAPGGMAEPRIDARASSRLLADIVDAIDEEGRKR